MFRQIICKFLDFYSYLFKLFFKLDSDRGSSALLGTIDTKADSVASENHSAFLSSILRKFPYWYQGHIDFARVALARKDYRFAYASAMAAINLSRRDFHRLKQAKFLLALSFLQSNQLARAIELLQDLVGTYGDSRIKEELAAAYIANEEIDKATQLFEDIGLDNLTQEARAAYDFVLYRKAS